MVCTNIVNTVTLCVRLQSCHVYTSMALHVIDCGLMNASGAEPSPLYISMQLKRVLVLHCIAILDIIAISA